MNIDAKKWSPEEWYNYFEMYKFINGDSKGYTQHSNDLWDNKIEPIQEIIDILYLKRKAGNVNPICGDCKVNECDDCNIKDLQK